MNERPLLILGAGTFAVEALEAAELSGREVCGFLVSTSEYRTAPTLEGRPVFTLDDLPHAPADVVCVAGIVSTKRRAIIDAVEARGYTFVVVKHPAGHRVAAGPPRTRAHSSGREPSSRRTPPWAGMSS